MQAPTNPGVSVVVPTFNRAHLLSGCIRSVMCQSYREWELIIVDDGSQDDTASVARQLAGLSPKIRYIRKTNGGVGSARNAGIRAARARLIACLDSDDAYLTNHLAHRLWYLSRNGYDLVQGGFVAYPDAKVVDFFHPERLIELSRCVVGGTFFGRKSVFEALGGFSELAYGEDTELWECAKGRFHLSSIDRPKTYILRDTPGSLRARRAKEWEDSLRKGGLPPKP